MARLQVQQSVAIERYDGIQGALQQAVSTELSNGDQATNLATHAQDARDAVVDRARALYMSGGQLSLIATVLSGSTPGDVLERAQTVRSVLGSDSLTAAADQAIAVQAAGVAKASTLSREQVVVLRQQATHEQPVRMPGLRRRGQVQRAIGQRVTVEHDNLLEPIGQSPGRGQPGDAGADNNGGLSDGSGARPSQVTLADELIHLDSPCLSLQEG